jgi:transcriptional regulator with XRE-family HTH domain
LRKKLGLNLREFAKRCGCTASYVSRLEVGSRKNPSPEFVDSVMTAFGVSRNWLEYGHAPIMFDKKDRDPAVWEKLRKFQAEEVERGAQFFNKEFKEFAARCPFDNQTLLRVIESVKNNDGQAATARFLTDVLTFRLSSSAG